MIPFYKYEACGNDFIFIPLDYCSKKIITEICDRHYGVGADGVIASDIDEFIYLNKDGSKAKLCGNGLRCFVLHQFNKNKNVLGYIKVGEDNYEYKIESIEPFIVSVKMKEPTYIYEDEIDNKVKIIDSGVKHIVLLSEKYVEDKEVRALGEYYNSLDLFKDGINVNVLECGEKYICRTFERGCGLTMACGSGALACFKLLSDMKMIKDIGMIYFKNGESLLFKKRELYIEMIGSARIVMEGNYLNE